jgi:hypothetical protein
MTFFVFPMYTQLMMVAIYFNANASKSFYVETRIAQRALKKSVAPPQEAISGLTFPVKSGNMDIARVSDHSFILNKRHLMRIK